MTVKELIEKLQNVDQDRDIYLDDGFSLNLIDEKKSRIFLTVKSSI